MALLGACFAWGIDNNLTRKVSLSDTTWISSIKGLVAGSVNLALAFMLGASLPPLPNLVGAMVVGFLSYGVSLACVAAGLIIPYTALGTFFGFTPLAALYLVAILALVISYLILVENIKRWFYHRYGW